MPSILLVCTANQCRSPLAEAQLRRYLTTQHPDLTWQIESAGTWASSGRSAHPDMRVAANEVGLDLTGHRARNVETLQLSDYDLILTMEQSHKEAIRVEFSAIRERVYQLSEMVGITYDVPDPIGGSAADFRTTVRELDRLLQFALPRIVKLASQQAEQRQPTITGGLGRTEHSLDKVTQ